MIARTQWFVVVAIALCGAPAVAEPPPHVWLQTFERQYLDGLFRAKPHLAGFLGDHRFDDKVVDLSPEALAAREKDLVAQQQAIRNYRRDVDKAAGEKAVGDK